MLLELGGFVGEAAGVELHLRCAFVTHFVLRLENSRGDKIFGGPLRAVGAGVPSIAADFLSVTGVDSHLFDHI